MTKHELEASALNLFVILARVSFVIRHRASSYQISKSTLASNRLRRAVFLDRETIEA